MKKHISFPSIEQFKNIVRQIELRSAFEGKDELGNPIYNHSKPKPILTFKGTVKLHGCVSAETILDTLEYGKLKIEKIVKEKIKCHVKALDLDKNEIVYSKISDFYLKENDGDWFEIELENGKKIEITGNNPVWLPRLKCYREVYNLKENDILLVD